MEVWNSGKYLLRGVMQQLAQMIHTAADKSKEIKTLEENTNGWAEFCNQQTSQELEEQARWSKLSGNSETVNPVPESVLNEEPLEDSVNDELSEEASPALGQDTLLGVFDKIDSDGFGFAPRMDLLNVVSELALQDSSLRFVVRSSCV